MLALDDKHIGFDQWLQALYDAPDWKICWDVKHRIRDKTVIPEDLVHHVSEFTNHADVI